MNNPVFRLVTNIYCISSLYRQNTSCFIMSALNDCFDTKTRLDNPFIISASGILVLRAWREGGGCKPSLSRLRKEQDRPAALINSSK